MVRCVPFDVYHFDRINSLEALKWLELNQISCILLRLVIYLGFTSGFEILRLIKKIE